MRFWAWWHSHRARLIRLWAIGIATSVVVTGASIKGGKLGLGEFQMSDGRVAQFGVYLADKLEVTRADDTAL